MDIFQDYDESDEDSEDEETEGFSEPVPNKLNRSKKKKNKKHKYSDESEYNSDSEEEEEDQGFSMTNMGNYFRSTYDTISNYMPAIPSVFGSDDDDEENENDLPVIRRPKLKKSSLFNRLTPYTSPSNYITAEEKPNRWYDKFFFGSGDSNDQISISTPSTPVVVTTEAGFFNWLSGDSAESSEKITTTEPSPPKQSGEQGNVQKTSIKNSIVLKKILFQVGFPGFSVNQQQKCQYK